MAKRAKIRKGRKPNASKIGSARAEALLKAKGEKLSFLNSSAVDEIKINGFQKLLGHIPHTDQAQALQQQVRDVLLGNKRTWTVAYAFISEVNGEVEVITDYFHVMHSNVAELGSVTTQNLQQEWRQHKTEDTFSWVWIAVPKEVHNAEEILEEHDAYMEHYRCFEKAYNLERLAMFRADSLSQDKMAVKES